MDQGSKKLVIYHAHCNDGFTSAWCAWRKFGDEAEFFAASYSQPPPDVDGKDVYILDFSYKREVMEDVIRRARRVVVLDHHRTAEAELAGLDANPKALIVFDMLKSGARLAWEFFHENSPLPKIVAYAEDRDLWKHALPFSKAVYNVMASTSRTFADWDAIEARLSSGTLDPFHELVAQGEIIRKYSRYMTLAICRNAREITLAGHKILAANSPVLFSEVAGQLATGRPFGATWFVRADGMRQWSLRSEPEGVDVSEVAKLFGGGGHPRSAGFEDVPPEPLAYSREWPTKSGLHLIRRDDDHVEPFLWDFQPSEIEGGDDAEAMKHAFRWASAFAGPIVIADPPRAAEEAEASR